MALRNLITVLLITNLVILQVVVEADFYNDVTDNFYKTYYVNKYNRNYRDNQEESQENMAKRLAKHIAVEISNESHNYEEQSRPKDDEKVKLWPRFIFPDEQLQTRHGDENRGTIIPANCGAQTFCENVSNYPQNLMDQLILNNSTLRHLATHDVMPIETRAYSEDDPLCVSVERLIRPQSARNMKNETLFIIQSNATDFVQAVRIETCLNENTQCRLIDVPLGYAMTCKQKYIYRELSAISKTGEVIRDHFKLPASCCCHSKFDPQIVVQQLQAGFRTRNSII